MSNKIRQMPHEKKTKEKNDTISPKHCFCQISFHELEKWVEKRTHKQSSVGELILATTNGEEKEILTLIDLLEKDDDLVLQTMREVIKPDHHILHCRSIIRHLLTHERPQ
ncbi:MAG: hypothetical protein JW795_10415 [Chitinivibrionales bacterium]|nr:hypothetical protein [Chitinivibrionales bacterium]